MTVLQAERVMVERGGRAILSDLSLRAEAGEFIALIGANGAGKSTLLSVLAGLLRPDAGSVTLDGRSIRHVAPGELARRRAYLPQNPRCEWPLSVERLVALGLSPVLPVFGGLPHSFAPRITRALEACDLLAVRQQPVTTLSGGELGRAMLARALVGEPDILIVDEPIAGLDPKHALDTAGRLRELARGGTLVIAALHDLTLAGRYAARVIALARGHVLGDGPAASTLTPQLIRSAFDVQACVSGSQGSLFVDYVGGG